ncbi:chromosome-associated kinesin KIF4 [Venturia canescens]|uniref:chromosome-associated kinesin KIF4 n=1 Tax=Venturia canescens TaxID=32260 RepID=UPI001C9C210A|nr:chromosome-associated kinesin KIF4 [Venturia canescens]
MSDDTVRVALRIRPLVPTEVERGCQTCISVVPGEQQVQVRDSDKSFTFNHVFGPDTDHEQFYNTAVKKTVNKIFKGYNVTILAYGQTGSGKTFSMGTNYNGKGAMGVIPRAVNEIFETINSQIEYTYKVTVSFVELYQEQLYDLLADKSRNERIVDVREDDKKGIKIVGLTERPVANANEAFEALTQGSNERATGATAMNAQSSRSHAIFTIVVFQSKNDDPNSATTSKFHLVDLAGSERSKKTQATGERFKEGVNINKGLLALGNVISQLGEGGPSAYIGYRDSKLTRLLQDSLGGNSMTLMIACISPADYNLDETLSTLRYADRARRIKNKPIVNQDPKAAEINRLNRVIQELRLALLGDGTAIGSCPPEHRLLQEKVTNLQKKLRELTEQLNTNLIEIVNMHERAELAEQAREILTSAMSKIIDEFENVFEKMDVASPERAMLNPLYQKVLDFMKDQETTVQKIHQHEMSSMCSLSKSVGDSDSTNVSINDSDPQAEGVRVDLDERHAEHTLRQAQRNQEVNDISRSLAMKEELISTLLRNSTLTIEHSKELQQMENELKTLQNEKEELLQALQNVQSNNASAKLAASRRKKVQELEKQISELSRKCTEQMRIIKKKEKSDEKIKNLSTEIQSLKQAKIKLIREMRKESEVFNKWKRESEREIYKLKDQDRKRQNQIVKLQTQHDKQQNVFKRKMEEAIAINKRLKDALELQRKAQSKREKNSNSKSNGMRDWVQHEYAILTSTIEAEASLEKMIQDRAVLSKELETLKTTSSGSPSSSNHITQLKEFLDLRNTQIADLQREIMESDQDNRSSTRLNNIQSMGDAKTVIKSLFETIAVDHRKNIGKSQELENKYVELMEKYDSALLKNRQYELRQQSEGRLKELEEELEMYKEKCENLEDKLAMGVTSAVTKNRSKKTNAAQQTRHMSDPQDLDSSYFHITDDSFSEIDDANDPDWKKTPLYKRIQKARFSKNRSTESLSGEKRSFDGIIKCSCKSQCSTRLCSCRKNATSCSNCNCNPEICTNRNEANVGTKKLFSDSTDENKPDNEDSTKRARLEADL